jgi:hypothetical protein
MVYAGLSFAGFAALLHVYIWGDGVVDLDVGSDQKDVRDQR